MAVILITYLIAVLIFFIIGIIGIFHSIRYKMPSDNALIGTYIFIIVTGIILLISAMMIFKGDWNAKPKFLESINNATK